MNQVISLIDRGRPEQTIGIYVACEIWDALVPDDDRLLVAIEGYGRFWIKMERSHFAPSFVIVALTGPLIPRLRQSPTAQAFLRGVNVGVVALILAVSIALFRSALVDVWTILILVAGLVALLRFRVDTFWLVLGGATVGLIHYFSVGLS